MNRLPPAFAPARLPPPQWPKLLNASLAEVDPELLDIIEKEKNRQWKVSLVSLMSACMGRDIFWRQSMCNSSSNGTEQRLCCGSCV